ncbi:MAG: 1-phosphofructokinase family hexose kinase [Defluviicoccus sp.]|jgi:1-phosphofructokinase family hexose kinase|nr:1-phosphofructokinase family hexose kinase [Defluviicoccus sp.]MDG4609084.1 1-phosphofructokinase family hexose kinase [Defluviicoccus sp.]
MRFLCITPNTSIDRTMVVPGFLAGGVWRAQSGSIACGGKGVNVARALKRLGQQPVCSGLLAGHTGKLAAEVANAEGLEAAWTWASGETRTCVIVVGERGATTVLNEPGPPAAADDWSRLVHDVGRLARSAGGACISGSLPPGYPENGLKALIRAASMNGRRPVWVDTSGAALIDAVNAAPYGIKINADEAAALLGWRVQSVHDAIRAAREIRRRGPERVAITLAADGAVVATGQGDWHARPPGVRVVSAVASGDCFLAGLMAGLAERVSPAEALRLATACGAANAMSRDAGDFEPRRLTSIIVNVSVRLMTG